MSKSKPIAEHEDALGIYFNDMLYEEENSTQNEIDQPDISKTTPLTKDEKSLSFQALLFDINGLQLAIRSQDVIAILPWPEEPLEKSEALTGSSQAVLGDYHHFAYRSHIIDTAQIVLPPKLQLSTAKPSFIIIFGEGHWGLSCHNINSVITLTPEDIKWRKVSGTRQWLAGTSIEKNCSIINIAELVNLLK